MGGMGGQPTSRITAQVAGPLTITFGDKSAEWTAEKLAALPHSTFTVWNEHARAKQSYSGVRSSICSAGWACPSSPTARICACIW